MCLFVAVGRGRNKPTSSLQTRKSLTPSVALWRFQGTPWPSHPSPKPAVPQGIDGDQSDNSARGSGAAYVFTRDIQGTWSQQAYIKASNSAAGDLFGTSVALSGDTLGVGAFGEESSATGIDGDQSDDSARASGAVYVFTRSGTTWTQQAYIKASNSEAGDQFGNSIAISADTLAVGATRESSSALGVGGDQADNSANRSGAVYLFSRSGGVWKQQAYLKSSNSEAADLFGFSLAFDRGTLAVGALRESGGSRGVNGDQASNLAPESGAVYVRKLAP